MEHNIQPQQPSMRKGRYFQCRHKTLCAWRKWPRSWASPSPTPTHKLNAELREKGYLTISGRVNRNFFMEKFCYGKTEKEG